jgi:predicted nicotinamide N-methyase
MDEEERWIEDESVNSEDDNDDEEEEENPMGSFDLFSTDRKDPKDEFALTMGKVTIKLNGIKARYPHLLQSTGMTLWKGSEKLCQFLCDNPEVVKGKVVIELGAGLGLCGIVAHKQGACQVILTDGDTNTLRNMRSNVAANVDTVLGSSVESPILCKQLLWGKNIDSFCNKWAPQKFDVVMGGDIAYAQDSLPVLFETAVGLLSVKPQSCFILSFVFRGGVTVQSIQECAERNQLRWEKVGDGDQEALYIFHHAATTSFK